MINSGQCRSARAFLGWTQADLHEQTGVSIRAIQDFEAERRTPNGTTLRALLSCFERSGIEFREDGPTYFVGFRGITPDPRDQGYTAELE